MSAITTSTCRPRSKARCSATVSASRGVRIRSITGSSAVLSSSTSSPAAERSSRASRTAAASAWVRPMPANTTRERLAAARWPARRSGWPAPGAAGPATEKTGSFCPRTRVVSASIADTPVSTGSAGGSRMRRVERAAGDRRAARAPSTGGPPSIGSPRPLQTRPSQPAPTGIRSGSPGERDRVRRRGRMPSVPSSTWTTARSRSTSRTSPCRSLAGVEPDPWRTRPSRRPRRRARPAAARAARATSVYSTRHAGPRLMRSSSSAASIASRRRRTPSDVVGSGLLAGPHQRPEVDLLDRGRRGTAGRPAPGSGRPRPGPRRPARRPWPAEQYASLRGSARSAAARPRAAAGRRACTIRSCAGSAPTPTSSASAGEPVGLGEQRRRPVPRAAPRPGRLAPACQAPSAVGVPGERAGPGDGRVVPGVGEVAVERPHGTDEALGVRGDRLGQVAARRATRRRRP